MDGATTNITEKVISRPQAEPDNMEKFSLENSGRASPGGKGKKAEGRKSPRQKSQDGKKDKLINLREYPIMEVQIEIDSQITLEQLVTLPEGEDRREWIASHTIDFLHQLQWLYGTIIDSCDKHTCPKMDAGPKIEYKWADGMAIKTPVKLSAVDYCARLFQWVKDQLDDECIFPSKIGDHFPVNFMELASNIFKRLFRVYGHVYHKHLSVIIENKMEAHLNASFTHFILFVKTYDLINDRDLAPLKCLIDKINGSRKCK